MPPDDTIVHRFTGIADRGDDGIDVGLHIDTRLENQLQRLIRRHVYRINRIDTGTDRCCNSRRVVAIGDDPAPKVMCSLDDSVHFLVRHCLPDRVWKQQAAGAVEADDVSAFANLIANSTSACISSIADCERADYCFDFIAKPRSP